MDTPRILLVDDDLALLEALPHLIALRIHGVQVETSASARTALERLQDQDYDAIVTDIKMPGMDGLEFLEKVQVLRPEIPTLLVTGHGEQTLIIQALRAGAYDFIQKPFDRVYLVAALHRAIHTRRLRRQMQEQQQALARYAHALEHLVEQRTRELHVATEAMEALVRDLLDSSPIASNRLVLHCARCDLGELCQQVMQAYTTGTGVAFTFAPPEQAVVVEVDRERISHMLIHLLSQVSPAAPPGTPVIVTLHQAAAEAIITVRGAGEKVAGAPRPSHVEQCSQAVEGEAQAGTGVGEGGLSLAQAIVEQHGGHIEIQGSLGQGQTCSIVLPLCADLSSAQASETTGVAQEPALFPAPQWLVS